MSLRDAVAASLRERHGLVLGGSLPGNGPDYVVVVVANGDPSIVFNIAFVLEAAMTRMSLKVEAWENADAEAAVIEDLVRASQEADAPMFIIGQSRAGAEYLVLAHTSSEPRGVAAFASLVKETIESFIT